MLSFNQKHNFSICEASVIHFPCVLTSVIMTVECLTWLLVMYFAPALWAVILAEGLLVRHNLVKYCNHLSMKMLEIMRMWKQCISVAFLNDSQANHLSKVCSSLWNMLLNRLYSYLNCSILWFDKPYLILVCLPCFAKAVAQNTTSKTFCYEKCKNVFALLWNSP